MTNRDKSVTGLLRLVIDEPPAVELGPPLSTRSIVLSLLLGVHPAEVSTRGLIRLTGEFGVSEPTLRVALSRMVSAGDLERSDGSYRLAPRLLERQRRQDAALEPPLRQWRGDWEIAIVTATGRAPSERAALRTELGALRLGELREGVWLRPANLDRPWPDTILEAVLRVDSQPIAGAAELARSVWDLERWAATADALRGMFAGAQEPRRRLNVAAAVVRHLLTDPHLPDELTPATWPAPRLRELYGSYQRELGRLVTEER